MYMKIFYKVLLMILLFSITSCIIADIHSVGVFKSPIKYEEQRGGDVAKISIPSRHENNLTMDIHYFGNCGGGFRFVGIMIPIIPSFYFNSCEKDGLTISNKSYLDKIGVNLQLRYQNQIYNPYFDMHENHVQGKVLEQDWVKFKIKNFSNFKNSPDKTIIIHKKNPDGIIFTKELPFDWKVVVETSGGL